MAHDREVGGIRCLEVLDHLSDYVDNDVETGTRARIEDHLRGCDWCEQFGGHYAQTVKELRSALAEPAPLEIEVAGRLKERLAAEMDDEKSSDGGEP